MIKDMVPGILIGVDIGGTFTDIACYDSSSKRWTYGKTLTRYPDFEKGVIEVIKESSNDLRRAEKLVHGTTIVTNTVIEGKGGKTGLVTTRGFADVLEIARSDKAVPHGHIQEKFGPGRPTHLVPRHLRLEADERVAYDGSIIRPLDEKSLSSVISAFKSEGVDVVAVSLINSYVNPIHEQKIRRVFGAEYPEASVHLSSEISPTIREYERTSTTVVNAYVSKVTSSYLSSLISQLKTLGYRKDDISIMTSAGGIVNSGIAATRPVLLVESGPAAGVIAARELGMRTGRTDVISFDMGGTTAKAALIDKGHVTFSTQYKVAALAGHAIGRGSQGGGYPINTVVMDIAEAGAGGGSIAWIDGAGALHVGPQSAGSNPGPACYGFGGAEPTVTDSNLMLGRINPSSLAGGRLRVSKSMAKRSIHDKVARSLDLTDVDAALGIVEIVNANMVRVIRMVTLERGYDPRSYVMIAFGSAAPQHAAFLADELQIPEVIVPREPGCFSATGLVIADPREDLVQTIMKSVDSIEIAELGNIIERMRAAITQAKKGSRRRDPDKRIELGLAKLSFEMRYPKQGWEITVPVNSSVIDDTLPRLLKDEFAKIHHRMYGYHFENVVPVITSVRLSLAHDSDGSSGIKMGTPTMRRARRGNNQSKDAEVGERDVFFERGAGKISTPVFDRVMLCAGDVVRGPALIDEPQSTSVVPPSHRCEVDRMGNLVILARDRISSKRKHGI